MPELFLWQDRIDDRVWDHAYDVVVEWCDRQDDGHVDAMVRDGARHFRLKLRLTAARHDGLRMTFDRCDHACECRRSGMCGHVAAVLLSIEDSWGDPVAEVRPSPAPPIPEVHLDDPPPTWTDRQSIQPTHHEYAAWQWLERMADKARPSPAQDAQQRLMYQLSVVDGQPQLRVGSQRLGKRGFGQAKWIERLGELVVRPPAGISDQDAELCRRIGAMAMRGSAYAYLHPVAAIGADDGLWRSLLASSRLLSATGVVISEGEERRLRIRCVTTGKGSRLVCCDASGSGIDVLASDPPWWCSGERIGPLTGAPPARVLAMVLAAPQRLDSATLAAATMLRGVVEDLPDAGVVPTACLHLRRVRLDRISNGVRSGDRVQAILARVSFLYPGQRVLPSDTVPVIGPPDGRIARNRSEEERRLAELEALGLMPLSDESWRTTLGISSPSDRVHAATLAEVASGAEVPFPPAVLAVLSATGWRIDGRIDEVPATIDAGSIDIEVDDKQDWFDLRLGVQINGVRVDIVPMLAQWIKGGGLPAMRDDEGRSWLCWSLADGRVLRLPEEVVRRIAEQLIGLLEHVDQQGAMRIGVVQAGAIAALAGEDLRWSGADRLRSLADGLRSLGSPSEHEPPPGLQATLYPYQRQGLSWLQQLRALGIGGILADDMGLGKTVQTIAHLRCEQVAGRLDRPALVVCPASMVGTWVKEIERFAPDLRPLAHHGKDRGQVAAELVGHHVIVTTYATLMRDVSMLGRIAWHLVVCDEAQAIKNGAAKTGDAVRSLETRHRLVLTGTPVENHLGELFTLLTWAAPGILGSQAAFERTFRLPIEQAGDVKRAELLRRRVAPFLLRRTKDLVAPQLPARTLADIALELGDTQRAVYESVRLAMDERLQAVLAKKGFKRARIEMLDALLKLRQACLSPSLVKGAKIKDAGSAKLDWLAATLPELVEDGRRILVFSSFTSFLDLVERDVLTPAKMSWLRIDGSTTERQPLIESFQAGKAPVFLLSLKAGGSGLTLTAADTVVLCDPWWNPAAEDQAFARAHRIGQDKPVMIYRLVIAGSVESRILALQARKRALAAGLWDEDGQALAELDEATIGALLAPMD